LVSSILFTRSSLQLQAQSQAMVPGGVSADLVPWRNGLILLKIGLWLFFILELVIESIK
jgi:hypothetical protein